MMKHTMQLAVQDTEVINPFQTPVLGGYQLLNATATQLQWSYPDTLGEDKLVIMMGALHTKDKTHQMVGKLLRD